MSEALMPDGSIIESGPGGTTYSGRTAINLYALTAASSAIKMDLEYGMIPRPGYIKNVAIPNIEAMTGKTYAKNGRLTRAGKAEALEDCRRVIAEIRDSAVYYEED